MVESKVKITRSPPKARKIKTLQVTGVKERKITRANDVKENKAG